MKTKKKKDTLAIYGRNHPKKDIEEIKGLGESNRRSLGFIMKRED